MQASYEPTDLAQFTAELASVFRSAVERAGLAFEVDCPPLPDPVYVDRSMWEKIVLNLLSNAFKFTFDGGVRVAVRAEAGHAVVTVADTGIGIPAREMPRLFERFHRVENARSRSNEGSGIGLALVQELVQLHGGAITASSAEGEGTTFTIRLPFGNAHLPADALVSAGYAATVSATADPFIQEALRWLPGTMQDDDDGADVRPPADLPPGAAADAAAGPDGRLPARVLVADDNADMRQYLARLLRTAGYHVTMVTDGQAALAAVRVGLPDLVITDVMMPRLDGFGLVAAVRADARTAGVPVLLLSARAGQEASVEGLRAGADDYLVKPFSAVELLARVRSNLEMARFRSRESQFRRTLVDSLQEGFFVTDQEGTILEANQAFLTLVGYGPDGLPYRWPHPWIPDRDTDPNGWAAMAEAFTDSKRDGGGRYTVPARHLGGHTVWLACTSASVPSPDGHGLLFVGTARDVTAERLAGQREATLAGFAAALAATGEISEMLTTAAREIAAAIHAGRVITALWSSDDNPAITGWPRAAADVSASAGATAALGAVRHQPAASVALLPGDGDGCLLAAPLGGTGSAAIVAEFPSGERRRADARELFSILTSHLGQVLAKARDFEQARAVALTLQHAILAPTELPHGFAARYTPAVPPLEVGGDWYDVVPLPGERTGVVVGDCVGRGLPAAARHGAAPLGQPGRPAPRPRSGRGADRPRHLRRPDPGGGVRHDVLRDHRPRGRDGHLQLRRPPAAHPHRRRGRAPIPRPGPVAAAWHAARRLGAEPGDGGAAAGATLMLYTDGLVERRGQPLDAGIDAAAAAISERVLDHPDLAVDHVMLAMTPPPATTTTSPRSSTGTRPRRLTSGYRPMTPPACPSSGLS